MHLSVENPVIELGPNSMTGFSTDGVLAEGDRAPIPYALYLDVRNWNA